ncbi:phospholipase D-like domain-containing protein, partial [Thiolapillus sp.]
MSIAAGIFLLFQVAGFISSLHAILNTRTSQGAIAWVVSLNTMPVIAVPAYWVFGRSKFQGYVDALKDTNLIIEEDKKKIHQEFAPFVVHVPDDFPEYKAITRLSTSPFLKGNRVELLVDGRATYKSLEEGIKRASSYILFQFYILRADSTGKRFMELLIDRAKAGVSVYVLYDELGSREITETQLGELRAAGIGIAPFNTTQGDMNRFQINFGNHRKIMVVDGKETWLGGLNIGDEYLGLDRKLSPWRDTHLHIEGPAALVAQSIFWSDWHWANRELLTGLNWIPQKAPDMAEENGQQACLRPRDRFWDIPVPKIDSAFDNLLVPQPSWSPSTTQQ